jgi:hypothetical protein
MTLSKRRKREANSFQAQVRPEDAQVATTYTYAIFLHRCLKIDRSRVKEENNSMHIQEVIGPLSEKAQLLKKGLYEHYKGNHYEVIAVARNSETLEEQVVYQALYGDRSLWIRPLNVFLENVIIENKSVPRFRYIGKRQ